MSLYQNCLWRSHQNLHVAKSNGRFILLDLSEFDTVHHSFFLDTFFTWGWLPGYRCLDFPPSLLLPPSQSPFLAPPPPPILLKIGSSLVYWSLDQWKANYSLCAKSGPMSLFVCATRLRISSEFLNSWKKYRIVFHDTWKLHEIQISVFLNTILWNGGTVIAAWSHIRAFAFNHWVSHLSLPLLPYH